MQQWVIAALSLVCIIYSASASSVSPIQKVVELLTGMLAKGKQAQHEEVVQYAAYKQFCDDTKAFRQRSIAEADETIEVLKADIQKNVADAAQLAKDITSLDADIAAWSGDLKAAAKVRHIEKADYDALHQDYSESVDALQRAITYLKMKAKDTPQASLAQIAVLKTLVPERAKKALELFFAQKGEEPLILLEPAVNAYESHSHGIIDLLEQLLDKFIDERTGTEKKEMNARHASEMLLQDLHAETEAAKTARGEKSVWRSKALQERADAEGQLTDTKTTRAADDEYLVHLIGTCGQKASDFEVRQRLRTEELQAIGHAINILSGNGVAGLAAQNLPSALAQMHSRHTALAQLRAGSSHGSPAQAHAAAYLARQAKALGSKSLSVLATRVADDPFAKVKKLIHDLITRLMEEANEEAEHKGWCDTELSTNEQTRKEKTQAVEVLHAEIDQLQASIAKLGEDIAELSGSVAELAAAMAKAQQLRSQEKQDNEKTIQDSQDAQAAVAQAIAVLREFYGKTGEAAALVQNRKQEPPSIFDGAYTGMQAESNGVIGLLQVVQSDFARLEADTMASEQVAQKTYDELMTNSKVDKAEKSKDIEHKQRKRQDQTQALTTKTSDLAGTQNELNAALTYYDKLKPSCVDSGTSYSDRVERRKEEIESLQEALRILNGEELA